MANCSLFHFPKFLAPVKIGLIRDLRCISFNSHLYLVTLGNFLHLKIPGQLFNPFSSSAWFFQGGRTVALASQARRYPVR